MLMAALIYIVQAVIATLVVRYQLKKMSTENIIVKEYKIAKDVISALIAGYKSK